MAGTADQGTGGRVAPPDPWDPLVRISHWGIAGAVIYNGLLSDEGGTLHVWVGWIAMAILLIRMGWGLIGSRPARFATFPPDPRAAMSHLVALSRGRPAEYPSHNPAGALMAYALWGCLAVVIATGLVMTDAQNPVAVAEQNAAVANGDWSVLIKQEGEDSDDREGFDGWAEEIHEVMANLMLGLAFLHIASVAVEGRALGRNLVRPMIRGPR